ncbi:hypothetical protein [Geodermatophilus sp. SYSU D00815]
MTVSFTMPAATGEDARHHEVAAAGNAAATTEAITALHAALSRSNGKDKILLRAAAGAGKSHALKRMVREALEHERCSRIAVTAFTNKQILPLARELGRDLGRERVCLFLSGARVGDVPPDVAALVTVAAKATEIPVDAGVVVATSHRLGVPRERGRVGDRLGVATNGERVFDLLMVDEAWQLPLHLFSDVEGYAPIAVGVGDVGQLPPLDPGANPWRGDSGHNPYRAWPTAYEHRPTTHAVDLPAVWRPTAEQLGLWRAFYGEWDRLDCVAGPGDRSVKLPPLAGAAADVWAEVATGRPTLLEVDGLADPEAPDVDGPLLAVVEELLRPLLAGGFTLKSTSYDAAGRPDGAAEVSSTAPGEDDDPLIVVLATRNQAVDDAQAVVDRLRADLELPEKVIQASTVDSWQGQTNGITIAIHPLSGADRLDEFNSAFGRLAVTCTRATHGLLMVARAGLDDLLDRAPARPGTPHGEPGPRSLPRQTHQRILQAFARGRLAVEA